MKIHRALMELELNCILAHVRDGQAALGINSDKTSSDTDFSPGILVGPDVVGISQGTIEHSGHPVIRSMRLYRHRTRHVLQPSCSRGRIRLVFSGLILRDRQG
jgi:hypothetical protein